MKKYKIRDDSRIEALRSFSDVKVGDIGGFIDGEENLSHYGNCWVYDNAEVYGNANVFEDAQVYGNANVHGNANVFGNATVHGNASVCGYSSIKGDIDDKIITIKEATMKNKPKYEQYYIIPQLGKTMWAPLESMEYYDSVNNLMLLKLPTGAELIVPASMVIIRRTKINNTNKENKDA